MKMFRMLPVLVILAVLPVTSAEGQCKAFAKKSVLSELGTYTHDGNYHAVTLTEGEEAELYKTFYSGMDYRLAIGGEENLPPVEFTVLDVNKKVLYSSRENNFTKIWDFNLESSQQLRIVIKVNSSPAPQDITPAQGCVAIMFGFKIE
ncbi:MAG: hypothetical protein WCE64_06395 [Bacteroidales bacterium]